MSRLTEKCLGKYLKKLIGRTDLEDALKRLENLTNEEVRMTTAQLLKATDTVGDRVRVVGSNVLDVDNKVAGVNDKVAVVIDGAQPFLIGQRENELNSDVPRGKTDEGCHTTSRR